jgi:putative ABC transport system permease protein
MALLAAANRRHFQRHPLQLLLAVLGIAVGVAMWVSVDLAIESSRRAFALSMRALTGRTTHHIVAGSGTLDETLYPKLRRELDALPLAPAVEGYVEVNGETFRLAGFDPFSEGPLREKLAGSAFGGALELLTEPDTVLISRLSAERLKLAPGATLAVNVAGATRTLKVLGTIEPEGAADPALEGLLLADIATAQEVLNKVGRLDRIDVVLSEEGRGEGMIFPPLPLGKGRGEGMVSPPLPLGKGRGEGIKPGFPAAADRIRRLLPPGVELIDAAGRNSATARMTHAFEINLRAMSLLALLVGSFLIHNTMTFAVLQRRPLLAQLRILGVTRREVLREILGEAALLGLVGGVLGLGLGLVAAETLVGNVTRTINDVFFVLTVTTFSVSPAALARGLLLGLLASLLAALPAASEAAAVNPAAAQRRSGLERATRGGVPYRVGWGIGGGGLGFAILHWPDSGLLTAIAGIFLLLAGYALLMPAALLVLARPLSRIGPIPFRLAVRGTTAALSRTGAATAALTVAVAAAVGVGLMVDSFRVTIDDWLRQLLQGDLYFARPAEPGAASPVFPPEWVEAATRLPGVAGFNAARRTFVESQVGRVELLAFRPAPAAAPAFRFKHADAAQVWARFGNEEVLLASEPFATRHDLRAGDTLTLTTPQGPRTFPIAGVFFDYRSDQGLVLLRQAVYARLWNESGVTSVGLLLKRNADPERLRKDLAELAQGAGGVVIRSNREIREASMDIFRRTFAVTHVLRLIAIGVAFIGILSALLALQLERAREYAVLRALGLTPRQLGGLVLTQTGFLGLAAGLLALPLGLLLAWALVAVINLRSFGWSMDLYVAGDALWRAPWLALAAALLAGIYPALRAGRMGTAGALREE